jgi:anaerobic ribonucleoside-triphosphate reductase activating protein
LLKYVNTGVVFQEIPDETTLSINISNCPCHCPGCHSKYLWGDIGSELSTAVIDDFVREFGHDITCICFMGGDNDPQAVERLAKYIHATYRGIAVGWYSGRIRVPTKINKREFDYLKIGPYIAHLGSLKEPTTNQRLYKNTPEGEVDITSRFWKKPNLD